MYKDISDLPTTLRETLSEATLELYLKAYRRAYGTLAQDEAGEGSRETLAHQAAMRAVEWEGELEEGR